MNGKSMSRWFLLMVMLIVCLPALAQNDRDFVRSGNKLYRQQKYAEAETEYRKALSKNSRNTQALYNLGCALLSQQKDSAAIVQFENAGKMESAKRRKAMAYHNIGVICQGHQMFAQAIEAYKESLRNNPSDNQTRYNLALCQRQMKNQKGGDNNKKKEQKQKQKQQKQNNGKNNQQKQQQQQQQPKPDEKMSKENAEQLLNAAIQEEKATQQRMKKQQQSAQRRRLQKNW